MRSARVTPNTVGSPSDYNALLGDAAGAASLLVHQMYGTIALPTNPTNGQTLTLDINGTNVLITFVSAIGSTPGNVLIAGTAPLTLANLIQLLLNPTITNSTQVAIGANTSANVTLVNYINWSASGTNLVASSFNATLYSPASSFSASTTVTGGSYTANTMALYVEPGIVYVNGTRVIYAGGSAPTVTAPSTHPRIDVLSIDNTGTLAWTTGTEASSPIAPTYPADKVALCELYNVVGQTALYDNQNQQSGQGYIANDVRPILGMPFNPAAIPDSLIPSSASSLDLGSSGNPWRNIYGNGSFLSGINTSYAGLTSFLAAESIATNAAVAAGYYQSDGGILLDALTTGSITTSGTSGTIPVTVGNNPNRILVAILISTTTSNTATSSFQFNSVNMTIVNSEVPANNTTMTSAILVAPSTGTHNLTFTGTSSTTYAYAIFSFYNCAQTSQPTSHHGQSTGSTIALTPSNIGAVVIFGTNAPSPTGAVSWENTLGSSSTFSWGDSGKIFPLQSVSSNVANFSVALEIAPFTPAVFGYVVNASASQSSAIYADNFTGYRSTAFIGFANASASPTAAVTVALSGVLGSFTSLVNATQYYLSNTGGAIATVAGTITRKVGIAISTTQLVITNIW